MHLYLRGVTRLVHGDGAGTGRGTEIRTNCDQVHDVDRLTLEVSNRTGVKALCLLRNIQTFCEVKSKLTRL